MKKIFVIMSIFVLFPLRLPSQDVIACQECLRGTNYTHGEYMGRNLELASLHKEYLLEKRSETHPEIPEAAFPPYEACVRAYILKGKTLVRRIFSLNDFQGFVSLDSTKEAIEFVRFRTSGHTFFLFRPVIWFEVFKRKNERLSKEFTYGECSPTFFEQQGLKELEIVEHEEYFEIHRDVLEVLWQGDPNYPSPPMVYRIVEKVFRNGEYLVEKQTILFKDVKFSDIPFPDGPH